MNIRRRRLVASSAALSMTLPARFAFGQERQPIRIGVLTDLNSVYRDVTGPTMVACVRQAADEFAQENPDIPVEVVVADHQGKPDVGLSIMREWFDRSGVDCVVDISNSALALAARPLLTQFDKVGIAASVGSSAITGPGCSPNMIHWTYDSWSNTHALATSIIQEQGDKWFFITADYLGQTTAQKEMTGFIQAAGGTVVGAALFPFGRTSDFSSFLLQAYSSGANAVVLAAGGDEFVNAYKQAREFGLNKRARLIGTSTYITDVLSVGVELAQGLFLCEGFYWDLNDRTRSFMKRVAPKLRAGVFPNMSQAGGYAGVHHYLKAVRQFGIAKAKASGRAVVDAMKAMPTDDDCFGAGQVRVDGRTIHAVYVFEVKTPDQVRYPGDVFRLVNTIPMEKAFRPLGDGGCELVR